VHLFRPSLSFLAEAQPRLETSGDNRDSLAEMHITFFISLLTKLEIYYLQYLLLLIYIIYGDRTIIGFVGFIAN
jgi:hypothetical protein